MSHKELTDFTLNDTQLTRVLDSAGVLYEVTPEMRQYLRYELLRLREEILKLHVWSSKDAQSTLRGTLPSLSKRLNRLIDDFEADTPSSLRPVLLEASNDKHYDSRNQLEKAERLKALFDRLTIDLRHVSTLVEYLTLRLNEYDFLQSPRGTRNLLSMDDSEKAKHIDSMGTLFRRFKKRDPLDSPLVLALIVLSRLFERLFPDLTFKVHSQYSKNGDTILNDLRFDTPGVRFAAVALKELRLKRVFNKSTLEEYKNAVGDGWNNHKHTIATRASLVPNPLH